MIHVFFLTKQERINSRFCQASFHSLSGKWLSNSEAKRVLSLKQHLLFWSLKPRVPDMMCDSKCTA